VLKARFFSVVLLLLLASLFVTRFSFYPLLRSYLELRYDVRLDIERTEICGFACLSIPTLTVERPGVFRLSAEGVTVAAGVRHSGAFGLAPVISRWEVSRAEVTVQDPAALMDDTDGPFLKDGLPPFPFGRIALERIAARIRIGAGELRLSDMTLDGDGRYTLTIPEASYTHPRLRKPFLAAGKTVFRAAGTAYALETIESTGNGLAFTGTAGAHTFRGTAHLQLDRILDQFDERRSSGDISVKFDASWQDGDPTLTADLRADRLGWDTFRIHDIAARLVADQRGLTVERLLLFDRGTPVLSLGGTMEWHEPTLRGTAHL